MSVVVVISPSKYISIVTHRYGSDIYRDFIRLIHSGHILLVADSIHYKGGLGCEDAVVLHLGMYHNAVVISNDTFKPKIGEEHEYYNNISNSILFVNEKQICDNEIILNFVADGKSGADALKYVVDQAMELTKNNVDPICLNCNTEDFIPEIIRRHRIFNVNKHLERCDRVVFDHHCKLDKYANQMNMVCKQIESESNRVPIDDSLLLVLNTKKQDLIERIHDYNQKAVTFLEKNMMFRQELNEQLTALGNITTLQPVSIASKIPFHVFGSENSLDTDVVILLEDYQKPVKFIDCQKLCSKLKYELEDLNYFDREPNVNLAVVSDEGTVKWVLKGISDETNNAVYQTYHFHKQYYPLMIKQNVQRNVESKILRAVRAILSQLSKSEKRHNIKNALKINQLCVRLEILRTLVFETLNFKTNNEKILTDTVKLIAFQLGQTMALIQHKELYTKNDVIRFDCRLRPYLMREKCGLELLTVVKNEFIDMIELMFIDRPYFKTSAEILNT
ncbi:unnamed protein product [Didymodactylos carnosus]|uniref:Uncharacterized protein n=1 Tax=Didymodactylos carnosus TaxID=1234261 RepID=A0A815BQV4_9BILA|nr:unnamed protein product [Didymodactylos carnosus]CAF1273664.1 unnamed protein product [Didymodactylos carnosus]CAF3806953.1 unnamed protein product [Didymodactylos carnosus]CAF4063379.1 unnamed protein product [Didymodactylos carnosus]